jgi:S1-C subfamily serine protease
LRDYQPGDTARLTVFRNGDERTLDVTLGERPK